LLQKAKSVVHGGVSVVAQYPELCDFTVVATLPHLPLPTCSSNAAENFARAAFFAAALAVPAVQAQVPAPAAGQAAAPGDKGPTTIDAERIDGVSDLEMSARGKAELRRDDTSIFGEQLRFNREFDRFEADGGARLEKGTDRFFGPRLRYHGQDGTGSFESPSYILQRDPPVRGNAERMEFLGPDRYRMTKGSFTTCEPGREDWRMEVEELELDYEKKEGLARGARLRFFDTTILNVPYMPFSLENQRKSGFLSPTYSESTRRGFEVGVPYYWNIAPEMDATITPIYMTKRGAQLKTNARYLGASYSGELNLEHMPEDQDIKKSRSGLGFWHRQQITPQLTTNIDLNRVSDSRYFVDLSTRVQQVSVGNLQRLIQLGYGGALFNTGLGYGTSFTLQRFQTLQDPLAPVGVPYHRVPQLNFGTGKNDIGGLADATLPAEYVRFTHPTLVQGQRVSLNPVISFPFLAPGYFVTPKVGARYVNYNLDRTALGQNDKQSTTIPWMSLDAGLVFDRPVKWFGASYTQTLEPRLFYVRAPFKDQSQMPVFDSGLADFNYAQLFTENRFAGGDRFGDANQLTIAATSRLLGPGGQELLRATLGQRYFFEDEKVRLTAGAPLRTANSSDLLAAVGGRLTDAWSFDTALQYDPHKTRAQRYAASLRYSPEIAKVMNLSYRFNRDVLRQIDASGQWPISPGWYGIGRLNYSLRDSLLLDGLAGIEYNAGCWVLRAFGRRIQAAFQTTSTEFFVQLEFSGLGQLGSDDTPVMLKRNIPGYSPTNPADRTLLPPSLRPRLPFEQVF